MMRSFQTYMEPQIRSAFRHGGLWSKARGDATERALEGLSGQLATLGAEREWNTAMTRARMLERAMYEVPGPQKAALGFHGQQTMTPVQSGGGGSPWAQAAGIGLGMMLPGVGPAIGGMLGGAAGGAVGGFTAASRPGMMPLSQAANIGSSWVGTPFFLGD